ncbi:MAG: LysR family transcriptional regulator [Proteobacteria bacterium]|nr:LysR family transcriptional regulator [Pseudomonadota bacterium]
MILLSQNLKAFVMTCELGTVVSAAKQLRVGQTAITQRIKNLEEDLGVTLFIRRTSGMTLTKEGHSLLRYCKNAEESERRTLSEITGLGRNQDVELVVTGPTSFMSSRAVSQLMPVMDKWPNLNLRFMINDYEDRSQLLKSGAADFAILHPEQLKPEFEFCSIEADEYVLLCHPKWKERSLIDIVNNERLFAFHPQDETSLNYLRHFNLMKHLKRPRLFANENKTLSDLLCHGIGYGILERNIARPFISEKKLYLLNEGKSMKDKLVVAWYRRDWSPTWFEEVLTQLRAC